MSEPPLTRRRSETQERLLAAAVPLFAERGIGASTVELICERAGFTRGAFYSNFESKDELVRTLLAAQRERLVAGVARAVTGTAAFQRAHPAEPGLSSEDLLEHTVRLALTGYHRANPPGAWAAVSLLSLEVSLYAVREPAVREAYVDNQRGIMDPLADLVELVLTNCRRRLTVSRAEAATTLIAVFQSSARRALTGGEGDVVDVVAPRYTFALRCLSEPID